MKKSVILVFFVLISFPCAKALTYAQNSTNNTVAGFPTLFKLKWFDNKGLSGYIFSTNNSGSWVNSSFKFFQGNEFPRSKGMSEVSVQEVDSVYRITGERINGVPRYVIDVEKNGSSTHGEVKSLSIFGKEFPKEWGSNLGFYVWGPSGYLGSGGGISKYSSVQLVERGPCRIYIHTENTSSALGAVSNCLSDVCWNSSIDIYAYPTHYIQVRKVWGNFSAIQMYVGGPTWQVPYGLGKISGFPPFSSVAWYFTNGSYYAANNTWGITIKNDNFMQYVSILFDESRHDRTFALAPIFSQLTNNPQISWSVNNNPTYYVVDLGFNGGYNPSPYVFGYAIFFGNYGNKSLEENSSVWLGFKDLTLDIYYPAEILIINGTYEGRDTTLTYNFTANSNLLRFSFSTNNFSRTYPVFKIRGLGNPSAIKNHIWYRNVTSEPGTWQRLHEGKDFLIQEGNSTFFGYDYILISLNATFSPKTKHEFWISNGSDPVIKEGWSEEEEILNPSPFTLVAWKFYANNSANEWNESETFALVTKPLECSGTYPPSSGDWIISDNTKCECASGNNITLEGNILLVKNGNLTIDNCLIWIDQNYSNQFSFQANGSSKFELKNSRMDSPFSFILSFKESSSAVLKNSSIPLSLSFFDSSTSRIENSSIYFATFDNLRNDISDSNFSSAHFTKGDNWISSSTFEDTNFTFSKNNIFKSNITYAWFKDSINYISNSKLINATFRGSSQNSIESSTFSTVYFEENSSFSIYNSSFEEAFLENSFGNYPLLSFKFPIIFFKTGFESQSLKEWDGWSNYGGAIGIDNESAYRGNYSIHVYNNGGSSWSHLAVYKDTINSEMYVQLYFKLSRLPPSGKKTGAIISFNFYVNESYQPVIGLIYIENESGRYFLKDLWVRSGSSYLDTEKVEINITPDTWHKLGYYLKIDEVNGEDRIFFDGEEVLRRKNVNNSYFKYPVRIRIGDYASHTNGANWEYDLYIDEVVIAKDANVDEKLSSINKLNVLSASNATLNGDFLVNQLNWINQGKINRNFNVIVRYLDESLPLAPIKTEVYDNSSNLIWSTITNSSYLKIPLHLNFTNYEAGNFTLRITDGVQENFTQIGFLRKTPLIVYLKPTHCTGSQPPESGDWIINVPTSCICSPGRQLLIKGKTYVYSDFNLSRCTLKLKGSSSNFYAKNFSKVRIVDCILTAYEWPRFEFLENSKSEIINSTFYRGLYFGGNSTNMVINSYSPYYYIEVAGESNSTLINSDISQLYIGSTIPHNLRIENLHSGKGINKYIKAENSNFTINLTNMTIDYIRFYSSSTSNNTIINSRLGYSRFTQSSKNRIINTTFSDNIWYPDIDFYGDSDNEIINSTFFLHPRFYESSSNKIINSTFYNETFFCGDSDNEIIGSVFYNTSNFYEESSTDISSSETEELKIGSTIPHTLEIEYLKPGSLISNYIKAIDSAFSLNLTNVNITFLTFYASDHSINLINSSYFSLGNFYANSFTYITNSTFDEIKFGYVPSYKEYIRDWLILGMFSEGSSTQKDCACDSSKTTICDSFIDETNAAPYPGKLEAGRVWVEYHDVDGTIDLDKEVFEPDIDNDYVVAYAFAWVYSPVTQSAQLRVGSDDGIIVWLNGNKVIDNGYACRSVGTDQDIADVALNQGWNRLLLRVGEREGDWKFKARFTDSSGNPLTNIKFRRYGPTIRLSNSTIKNWSILNISNSTIRGNYTNLGDIISWEDEGNVLRYFPVRVLYKNGVPAQGANVSIYASPEIVWSGCTNSEGYAVDPVNVDEPYILFNSTNYDHEFTLVVNDSVNWNNTTKLNFLTNTTDGITIILEGDVVLPFKHHGYLGINYAPLTLGTILPVNVYAVNDGATEDDYRIDVYYPSQVYVEVYNKIIRNVKPRTIGKGQIGIKLLAEIPESNPINLTVRITCLRCPCPSIDEKNITVYGSSPTLKGIGMEEIIFVILLSTLILFFSSKSIRIAKS